MTALPLLITTATVAYTIFFPYDKQKTDGPSNGASLTKSWWSQNHHSTPMASTSTSAGTFLLGIFVGMNMSWMIAYEIKRRRLWETVRLKLLSWLYDGSTSFKGTSSGGDDAEMPRLVDKYRTPTLLSDLKGTPIPRKNSSDDFCGTHLEYLSPDWTLASGFYVDVLTLPSGSELVPSKATGVEFYFVIKGNGTYSRNGETFTISSGYCFISDPGT
jgi:mannose-6-phosphate isomerase-like protein (cupin superfamily)